jgi:hypothetical protein
MTKGYHGESCAEAFRASMENGEVITATELCNRVKQMGTWKEETICEHMMGLTVNLPPARYRWKTMKPFLFIHEDGRYELYDPKRHPRTIE